MINPKLVLLIFLHFYQSATVLGHSNSKASLQTRINYIAKVFTEFIICSYYFYLPRIFKYSIQSLFNLYAFSKLHSATPKSEEGMTHHRCITFPFFLNVLSLGFCLPKKMNWYFASCRLICCIFSVPNG